MRQRNVCTAARLVVYNAVLVSTDGSETLVIEKNNDLCVCGWFVNLFGLLSFLLLDKKIKIPDGFFYNDFCNSDMTGPAN